MHSFELSLVLADWLVSHLVRPGLRIRQGIYKGFIFDTSALISRRLVQRHLHLLWGAFSPHDGQAAVPIQFIHYVLPHVHTVSRVLRLVDCIDIELGSVEVVQMLVYLAPYDVVLISFSILAALLLVLLLLAVQVLHSVQVSILVGYPLE